MSFLALAAVVTAAISAPPQPAVSPADTADGTELTVYLMTFGVGAQIWERFGHNAIWIHDTKRGTDYAYDYGRFDFQQEHFFLRFAKKDMLYWTERGNDAARIAAAYQYHGRSVWIQELDLPLKAREEIRSFLEWNIRPENKYYHYDYYLDNCSTRIRDILDRAVGGQLKRFADSIRTTTTYRAETRRLTEHNPFIYALLMIGLGQPTDRTLTAWEQMFLPIVLRPYLNRLTVTDPDGRTHPLVKSDRTVFLSDRYLVNDTPAPWTPRFWLVGVILGGALAWAGRRSGSLGRNVFLAGATLWSLLAGIAGVALIALWALTAHTAAYWNENLFQFSLLSLGLAVVIPRAVRRTSTADVQLGTWLAGLVAATAAVGLITKVLPGFSQANLDIIGLALPIHAGVFVGLWKRVPSEDVIRVRTSSRP